MKGQTMRHPHAVVWMCGVFLAAVCVLSGCADSEHGRYTRDMAAQAEKNKDKMTAAAAYDSARQRFLGGKLDEALTDINSSIKLNDQIADSMLLRTQILMEIGRDEQALKESVEHGLKISGGDARFHYFLGVFYERRGQSALAEERYLQAAALDPGSIQYKLAAAEMMIEQGRYGEAREFLQASIREHPNAPGLLQTHGCLEQIVGNNMQAKLYFSEALALAPGEDVLKEHMAISCFRLGEYTRALPYIEDLLSCAENKDRYDLQLIAAKCYIECNRPVDARELLKDQVKNPSLESYGLWENMADIAILLEDWPLLHHAAERMLVLQPEKEVGYLAMARYHEVRGERGRAVRILDSYNRHPARGCSELFAMYHQSLRE